MPWQPLTKFKNQSKRIFSIFFADIDRFLAIARRFEDPVDLFDLMNGMAAVIIRHIGGTNGRVIKFIGDSVLIVFPGESADEGTRQLLNLRDKIIEYFRERDIKMGLHVGIHYGEAVIGPFGEGHCRSIDVLGESVNKASVLAGRDYRGKFVITPQAFRKLRRETRKLFHKYTPPMVYMAE